MRNVLFAIAVVAGAAFLPACHHGVTVSSDPTQPLYRNPSADLSQFQTLKIHFVSITTNNNEGVDLVRSAFLDSLKQHLGPQFRTIVEGDSAGSGEAILDVDIQVNWGSQVARAMVGFGAGKAGIIIKYNLKDPAGSLLAKLDRTDSMSGGFYGGDGRNLAFAAADKWNRYFATTVLAKPAAEPAK